MRTKALLDDVALVLDEVERAFGETEVLGAHAPSVSAWTVGAQLQHVARANALCLGAVSTILDGEDARLSPGGTPSVPARLILRAGIIPRGKADAPASTVPAPGIDVEEISGELAASRELLYGMVRRSAAITATGLRFPHPILGMFSAHDWLRFTAVHARHHLALVRDILAAR